jgi:hypothetical protein
LPFASDALALIQSLWVSECALTTLEGLPPLAALRELTLHGNALRDLGALPALPSRPRQRASAPASAPRRPAPATALPSQSSHIAPARTHNSVAGTTTDSRDDNSASSRASARGSASSYRS